MNTDTGSFNFFTRTAHILLYPTIVVQVMYWLYQGVYFLFVNESFSLANLDVLLDLLFHLIIMCYALAGMSLIEMVYKHFKDEEEDDEEEEEEFENLGVL